MGKGAQACYHGPMLVAADDALSHAMEAIAIAIEALGVAVIVVGGVVATWYFVRRIREQGMEDAYASYRAELGKAILLGLEFLVAADIIGTVSVHPTYESLGILGLLVIIRTFLSFSLEVEIEGHWPWQASRMALRRAELQARTGESSTL